MFLLLVGLACLLPVSLYCLFLAMLHQRRHPTPLSGPWDFAGVLAALSGFLLIGGTALLFAFHSAARDAWLTGSSVGDLRQGYVRSGTLAVVLWGCYGVLLLGGAGLLLWWRADRIVFYNLAPAELEQILGELCIRLQLPCSRRGLRYYVGFAGLEKMDGSREFDARRKLVLDVDGSEAMRQVTLRWAIAEPELRREVEAELARDIAAFEAPSAPTAGWFLTAAGSLMVLTIFTLGMFLLLRMR